MTLEQRITALAQAMGVDVKALYEAINAASTETTWESGMVVETGEKVLSPLDKEVYRRVTATGGGAVDPADDIVNYNAASYERVTSIPAPTSISNGAATPGDISSGGATPADFANGSTKVLPGVIALGTRKLILALTGRGLLTYLGWQKATIGGGRFELIVDGRSIFDGPIQSAVSDATIFVGSASIGVLAGPVYRPSYYAVPGPGIEYRRSVAVWFTPAGGGTVSNTTLGHITRQTR